MAGADTPMNYERVLRTLLTTDDVLDPRDIAQFQHAPALDSDRRKALLRLFRTTVKEMPDSSTLGTDDDFLYRLRDRGIKARNVQIFFMDTLLLFRLIKDRRETLIDKQFEFWQDSLSAVDFRWLDREDAERWGRALLNLMSAAFASAGPWSETDLKNADAVIINRLRSQSRPWIQIVATYLRNMDTNVSPDPKMKKYDTVQTWLAFGGGLVSLFASWSATLWYGLPLLGKMSLEHGGHAGCMAFFTLVVVLTAGTALSATVVPNTVRDYLRWRLPIPEKKRLGALAHREFPLCRELVGGSP